LPRFLERSEDAGEKLYELFEKLVEEVSLLGTF